MCSLVQIANSMKPACEVNGGHERIEGLHPRLVSDVIMRLRTEKVNEHQAGIRNAFENETVELQGT